MSSFQPRKYSAFADADAFLNGGRNKNNRPVKNNTSLRRVSEDSIALVLHRTAVVTYHRDGTQTIYGGGYNTVTTKDRISGYSVVNPGSNGHGFWVIGHTGEHTPAKVQKCRSCSRQNPLKNGAPTWITDDWCRPNYWSMCNGATEAYTIPYGPGVDFNEHWESRYKAPCEHGEMERHVATPCQHGLLTAHVTGQSEKHCYGCNGTGQRDYGSKPIPVLVSADVPFRVDANGNLIDVIDGKVPETYAMRYIPEPKRSVSAFEWEMGEAITTAVLEVLPSVNAIVKNPSSGTYDKVSTVVLTLHDTHRWSDERIIAWLSTYES